MFTSKLGPRTTALRGEGLLRDYEGGHGIPPVEWLQENEAAGSLDA